MTAVLVTERLTKVFGRSTVVDSVDLEVREGDRFGFLGPNGSGKTTTLRMALGLVRPTRGSVQLLGEPMPRRAGRVLPQVGALIEAPAAYGHLSARANLSLFDAAGTGGPRRTRPRRVEEALERVGLAGVGRKPVKDFSLGMRQRLGLAAALLRTPRFLVLDEPSNGLDPQGMAEVRDLLVELNRQGATLLVSSHLLAEVEAVCTRIGVLDRGRLVLQDDLHRLRAPTGLVVVESPDADAALAVLDGRLRHRDGEHLLVAHEDPAALNARLVEAGVRVRALYAQRRSLEEVVLAVTSAGSDRVDSGLTILEQP